MKLVHYLAVGLVWLSGAWGIAVAQSVHHDISVSLQPAEHRIEVVDKVTLPQAGPTEFYLHEALRVQVDGGTLRSLPIEEQQAASLPLKRYGLEAETNSVIFRYVGKIDHPLDEQGEEYARSFRETLGLISDEGVFLAGSSVWYPIFGDQSLTFDLSVSMPSGWRAVSQGARLNDETDEQSTRVTWQEMTAQEEIYLIAARFSEYTKSAGAVEAMAFLRQPDPALAQRYLDVTAQYIEMYRQLIGPYPYSKFALVENFWETGYGMPSFTLLGPKVIRLPFILHSSYPHEILHNWWGNGVYVDYEQGNWAEGLTSYLADHLIQEQRQQGPNFRRNILQNYADFVGHSRDFPLTEFRSRHSSSSEAIGYGKTQMVFHMLRQTIGDEAFIKGLHHLYMRYKFKQAGFDDLAQVFSDVSSTDLTPFFDQWVKRAGAPALQLGEVEFEREGDGWLVHGNLQQTQSGEPFDLYVSAAVTVEGGDKAEQVVLHMDARVLDFTVPVSAKPLRIDLDPEFDLFRSVDRAEIPPALSQAFGAEQALLVLPSAASAETQQAYREMAVNWTRTQVGGIEVVLDSELESLPSDRAVWLLGWNNLFAKQMAAKLQGYGAMATAKIIKINGESFNADEHAVVMTAREQPDSDNAVVWLASDRSAAIPGLARKLPHYRKYSYLAFKGDEPTNVAKGQWPVNDSPMSAVLEPGAKPAERAARHALAQLPPVSDAKRMMDDVSALAAPDMQGRGLGSEGLEKAADYIANAFAEIGLQPAYSNGNYFQEWTEFVPGLDRDVEMKNVIAIIPGSNKSYWGESVVIGAHYDHLGLGWPDVRKGNEGQVHAGADDNASGVAVMLELARMAKQWQPERSIVFVAFTGEETDRLGSTYYVRNYKRYPANRAIGMINLDTVGRLGEAPVTVFGTGSAREWVHIIRGIGFVTGIKLNPVPKDFGSSDQKSFLDVGVPAVQLFGGVHSDFHSPSDTIDKVQEASLIKMVSVAKEMVEYLVARPESMTATLDGTKPHPIPQRPPSGRKVSMGTVPDFNYGGPGVLLTDVVPDSPAAKAGLMAKDLIVRIDGAEIGGLQDFAQVLRKMDAGQVVKLTYRRSGRELSVEVVLEAR